MIYFRLPNDLNFCRHLRLRKDFHFDEENEVDDKDPVSSIFLFKFSLSTNWKIQILMIRIILICNNY